MTPDIKKMHYPRCVLEWDTWMAQQPVKLPPNHLLIAGQGLPPLHSPSLPSWVSLGKGCSIATAPAVSQSKCKEAGEAGGISHGWHDFPSHAPNDTPLKKIHK